MIDYLSRAIQDATKWHSGQTDKVGEPYILHPLFVMSMMVTEEERVVALLHDILEDTDMTISELRERYSATIVDAVMILTHNKSFSYKGYITKIINSGNKLAVKVKMGDLRHNTMPDRIKNPTEADSKRREKYEKAWTRLWLVS